MAPPPTREDLKSLSTTLINGLRSVDKMPSTSPSQLVMSLAVNWGLWGWRRWTPWACELRGGDRCKRRRSTLWHIKCGWRVRFKIGTVKHFFTQQHYAVGVVLCVRLSNCPFHVFVYVCVCVCTRAPVCVSVCVCLSFCLCVHIVCVYCMCVCLCVCVWVHVCVCVCSAHPPHPSPSLLIIFSISLFIGTSSEKALWVCTSCIAMEGRRMSCNV